MSLLLVEGYDDGLWDQRVTLKSGSWTALGSGRTVGAVRSAYNGNPYLGYTTDVADRHATMVVGVGIMTTRGYNVLSLYGDGNVTEHVRITVSSLGEVIVYAGNSWTEKGRTDPGVVQPSTWHYLEVYATLHDTAGVVKVAVDGKELLNLTGIDTKQGGTATVFDTVRLKAKSNSTSQAFDDLYICNGAGTIHNDFLGDSRIYTLFPNGNGNYSQLVGSDLDSTDNYLLVDESTPDTADYVGSATVGDKDSYAMDDLPVTVGTVLGVAMSAYAAKSDAGTKQARMFARHSATDAAGPDHNLSTSYLLAEDVLELDPITSAAWTITNVNATEYGFEVRA